MDNARFDRLTRTLAGASRRTVLKTAFGVALAGVMGARLETEAVAAVKRSGGDICRKDNDCASGRCRQRDATGRSRCSCPAGTGGTTCLPSSLTVSFAPTDNVLYCSISFSMTNFEPNASFMAAWQASDGGEGVLGPFTTDATGASGPNPLFSYSNLGRSVMVEVDGVSSAVTPVACAT